MAASEKQDNVLDEIIFASDRRCNEEKPDLEGCKGLDRMLRALKYYTALRSTQKGDKNGQETFANFIQAIYPKYLEDIA